MEKEVETSGDALPPPYKAKSSNVSFNQQPNFQQNNQGEPFVQEKRQWDDECCLGCSKKCCLVSGIVVGVIGLILLILVVVGALWFQSAFSSRNSNDQNPSDEDFMCICNLKGDSKCKNPNSPSSSDSSGSGDADGEKNCKNSGLCLWEEGKDGTVKRGCGKSDEKHEYGCLKIDGVTKCLCDCPRCNGNKPGDWDGECWGTDCSKDESIGNSSSNVTGITSSTGKPNERPHSTCYSAAFKCSLSSHLAIFILFIVSLVSVELEIKNS